MISREIKFRAWHNGGKYPEEACMLFVGDDKGTVHPLDCCKYFMEGQPVKLMQYTGLKDKNDVEIYEGDILSYWDGTMIACKKDDDDAMHYPKTSPYYFKKKNNKLSEVVFDAPSFKIKNGNPLLSSYLECKEIEVVGNIYQNPELLEKIND